MTRRGIGDQLRISDPVKRKKAKKRCRKKFAVISPISLVRATLTWDATNPGGGGNIDLDLWVFDSSGNYYVTVDGVHHTAS